jgi:hypothetical protein
MSLVHLAPDLQEELLFLPRTERGRDPVILRDLQPIAAVSDWGMQRVLWVRLLEARPRRLWPLGTIAKKNQAADLSNPDRAG